MQYLVREVQSNSTGSQAMIFKTIADAVKHLQKINSPERLVVGEQEDTLAQLEGLLKQRLATVALHTQLNKKKQWVITAFE
jgi:hypothetical protein